VKYHKVNIKKQSKSLLNNMKMDKNNKTLALSMSSHLIATKNNKIRAIRCREYGLKK
jgi:hypothetical protein